MKVLLTMISGIVLMLLLVIIYAVVELTNNNYMKKMKIIKVIKNIMVFLFLSGPIVVGVVASAEDIDIYDIAFFAAIVLIAIFLIVLLYFVLKLILKWGNKYRIGNSKDDRIYVRDISVDYSPAVLSFLQNQKIEVKKDVTSSILQLCSLKVLKLQKNSSGKSNIIDLENTKEVNRLSSDQKYLYDMITGRNTNNSVNGWKQEVLREYNKRKFSKLSKINLTKTYFIVFIVAMLSIPGILMLGMDKHNEVSIYTEKLVVIMITALPIGLFLVGIVEAIISKIIKNKFGETYTIEGAYEMSKWVKFKNHIKEFSNIENMQVDSVEIWEGYMAYSMALNINREYEKKLFDEIENLKYNEIEEGIDDLSENYVIEGF